jgi:hypothetical protein
MILIRKTTLGNSVVKLGAASLRLVSVPGLKRQFDTVGDPNGDLLLVLEAIG